MPIQVGERLPDVPLTIASTDGPKPTTSSEYFAGKRVALFAVPAPSPLPAPRVTCLPMLTRRRSSKARALTKSPAFRSTIRS